MVTFSKLRREKAFLVWQREAESSKARKFKKKEVDEDKLVALRRIVRRNYLKLFVEICERMSIYERVAIRLACASHLNAQKALWRLLVNAKNSPWKWSSTILSPIINSQIQLFLTIDWYEQPFRYQKRSGLLCRSRPHRRGWRKPFTFSCYDTKQTQGWN